MAKTGFILKLSVTLEHRPFKYNDSGNKTLHDLLIKIKPCLFHLLLDVLVVSVTQHLTKQGELTSISTLAMSK
jgi:hypothetical protein